MYFFDTLRVFLRHVVHNCNINCNMNDSERDPYESGKDFERSDLSDDKESSTHQDTDLHDNSGVISIGAKSDGEWFDPTNGDNSFSLEVSMVAYCKKYFYQHLKEDSNTRNILDAAPVLWNFWKCRIKILTFIKINRSDYWVVGKNLMADRL